MRDKLNKRVVFVAFLAAFFLVFVFVRVLDLQFVKGDYYRGLAKNSTVKSFVIPANRGNVYGAGGDLLATSVSEFVIRMDPVVVNPVVFEEKIEVLSDSLSGLFGKSSSFYQKKIRVAREVGNRYMLLARKVSYADYQRVKGFPIFNLGVYRGGLIAEQKTVRLHPLGKISERTIGYDDYRGGAGIEGAFSEELMGVEGLRMKQKIVKNQWKPINDSNEKEPIDGRDIVTTIDVNIQDVVHHALLKQMEYFKADHGCAVVMEVNTGKIRAISNLGKTKNGRYFEKRNYAVWESHEPGSTFKLASLMIGLEDKVIDTSTVVDCEKGRIFISGKKVEDSEVGGHGKISMARAFEVSSNVGIVKAIRKYYDKDPEKFTEKLSFFGLDKKLGVKIKGEGEPFIPKPDNKKRWNSISLEWMAWGYGVSLTPLQVLAFYNAVANKGELVKPRFVEKVSFGEDDEQVFGKVVLNEKIASHETLEKVKRVMENVVRKGTAENIYSPNFSMAGKTGTAKKWIPRYKNDKGEYEGGYYSSKRYVASFAGFFPVDKPKYSCIVVIHDPEKEKGYYGAKVAAPVFKEIAQKIYTSQPSKVEVFTDSILGLYNGSFDDKYALISDKFKTIMPNVKGMSAMDAVVLLENMGLNVKYSGVGKVSEQSVKKGLKVKKGATIYLKLS